MFSISAPDLGLKTNSNHINVKWDKGNILFSMTRRGNGLSCHIASDKKNLRRIKEAINEFCDWAFSMFAWCEVILAVTELPSIERVIVKCGFKFIDRNEQAAAYGRFKNVVS